MQLINKGIRFCIDFSKRIFKYFLLNSGNQHASFPIAPIQRTWKNYMKISNLKKLNVKNVNGFLVESWNIKCVAWSAVWWLKNPHFYVPVKAEHKVCTGWRRSGTPDIVWYLAQETPYMAVWLSQTVTCISYKFWLDEVVHEKVKGVVTGPQEVDFWWRSVKEKWATLKEEYGSI